MDAGVAAGQTIICFSYEHRSAAEARVYEAIMQRYAARGFRTHNLFDADLHRTHEAGFNLARWEALDRFIKREGLFDVRIIMQDITDVFVVDPEGLQFDARDVLVNRKKSCQFHAVKTLIRDVRRSDARKVNLARRIDVDCTRLDASGLARIFFDPRYRSIYRFSNDVAWGTGRAFVELHGRIQAHIGRVPESIRHGNCDETLFTHFWLHVPEAQLNLRFGDVQVHNYNYIAQVLLGAASARETVKTRRIFTYQHSDDVPRLIDEMCEARPASAWRRVRPLPAYGLDRVVDGVLSLVTILLQEAKRFWIAFMFLRVRLGGPRSNASPGSPLHPGARLPDGCEAGP